MEACCDNRNYRVLVEEGERYSIEQCALCGRRHYTIRAPAVIVGVALNDQTPVEDAGSDSEAQDG